MHELAYYLILYCVISHLLSEHAIKSHIFLQIINLPSPYETNCTNGSLSLFSSDSNAYTYTKKACLIKCRNDYTIKRCGCTPPEFKGKTLFCNKMRTRCFVVVLLVSDRKLTASRLTEQKQKCRSDKSHSFVFNILIMQIHFSFVQELCKGFFIFHLFLISTENGTRRFCFNCNLLLRVLSLQ